MSHLPDLVQIEKELPLSPNWVERAADILEFSTALEANGVILEGLSLRCTARRSLADRQVMFQLEYHEATILGGPVCRIEWRPLSGHNNKGYGPKELRHVLQNGTHHHRFDLNWERSPDAVLRGDLPIAVPIQDDPANFRALLALVGKEFRINKIQVVTVPPWQPSML
jgi:hypothetical protein